MIKLDTKSWVTLLCFCHLIGFVCFIDILEYKVYEHIRTTSRNNE